MLIRAEIEHEGRRLGVARRKGNKNTLLRPDGTAFDVDPLAPLLGGIDRALFERMFGLDHDTLRRGGEAMLAGKDDAARTVFEAGAALPQLGLVLAALEAEAAELFKPGGSKPTVNARMSARKEALERVRGAEVSDKDWTAVKIARSQAEAREAALKAEAQQLTARRAAIVRIRAASLPLARLEAAERALAELADVPSLPSDAADRLRVARGNRGSAESAQTRAVARLDAIDAELAKLAVPEALLAIAPRIDALAERRPVMADQAKDLPRRQLDFEGVEHRLQLAKAGAKLPLDAPLPPVGWRKRARGHLGALDQHVRDHAVAEAEDQAIAADDARLQQESARLADVVDGAPLREAFALWPAGWGERLTTVRETEQAASVALEQELDALAPWRGDMAALRSAGLPWPADVIAASATIKTAEETIKIARLEADRARDAARTAASDLEALGVGGPVPTTEAVMAARLERDTLVGDVTARLGRVRQADDPLIGARLVQSVVKADHLADRREAEAARVARHAELTKALAGAKGTAEAQDAKADEVEAALIEARRAWSDRLALMAITEWLPPGDFELWRAARQRALSAAEKRDAATRARNVLEKEIERARSATATVLGGGPADEADDVYRAAERRLKAIDESAAERAGFEERAKQLDQRRAKATGERVRLLATAATLETTLAVLLAEIGLSVERGRAGLEDALEAAEAAAGDEAKRPGLERQVQSMTENAVAFATDARALAAELGYAIYDDPAAIAFQLEKELAAARTAQTTATTLAKERAERATDRRNAEVDHKSAQAVVDGLLEAARASSEAALDQVIAANVRRMELERERNRAGDDLLAAAPGHPRQALAEAVAQASADDLAAELAEIDGRLNDIGDERSKAGAALKEAEMKARAAATMAAAAEAHQDAVALGAELADAAEDHVGRAAAAAMLKWAINKHRDTNQAPLIARAGAMLAKVTNGGFRTLKVGFDSADRPSIRAIRGDGTEVGVDGLSEGTRDQLYLALRVASLQDRDNLRLPLICDDVLIAADEERTGQLLAVLAEAACTTQVIVFSHHQYVIDAARSAIGPKSFQLHRLEREPAFA